MATVLKDRDHLWIHLTEGQRCGLLHGNKTGRILSSVNAICIHISLTDSSCVEVTCGPTSSADTVMGASAWEQRWEECFHLFIRTTYACPADHIIDVLQQYAACTHAM